MISAGGPFHTGGAAGSSSGAMDRLRLSRIARRYASDRSVDDEGGEQTSPSTQHFFSEEILHCPRCVGIGGRARPISEQQPLAKAAK